MRIATAIARITSLPARHKAIAVALTAGVIAASCALPFLLPPRYTSTAVLSWNLPVQNPASDSETPLAQASDALADQLETPFGSETPFGLALPSSSPPLPSSRLDLPALRKHVSLSQTAPAELRLTYTGPDASQAQPAVQAFTALLLSWQPHKNEVKPPENEAKLAEMTPEPKDHQPALHNPAGPAHDPAQDREQALLRVTIAVLDANLAELRTGQQQHPTADTTGQNQVAALLKQKDLLLSRLAESGRTTSQPAAPNRPVPATSLQTAPLPSPAAAHPFTLIEPATAAQSLPGFSSAMRTYGILAGIMLGLSYLAFTLWRFRPVADIAALEKLLPREILLVGAIGDFHP